MKPTVMQQSKVLLLCTIVMFFSNGVAVSEAVDFETMSKSALQEKIATLGLGFGDYVVGKQLTAAQQFAAEKNHDYKAYPGTVKFKDGEVFVIVDKETSAVIALYKRNKKANKNDFKTTIAELMMQYGEPTTEAHGKIIYWSYGPEGLITEEFYRTVKSQGKLKTLDVIATVKFTSSENVATITDLVEMMDKKNQQGEEVKKADVTSDNYVMIQSDVLTRKYIKN